MNNLVPMQLSSRNRIIHGDCLDALYGEIHVPQMIFADPPDNIGLKYASSVDSMPDKEYTIWLAKCIEAFIFSAPIVWLSYNARWTFTVGAIVLDLMKHHDWLLAKPCVQTFTFGQHNSRDLGNNHRPLLRLMRRGTSLYPDAIRVASWRQQHGDKRANPKGRVPGDVFDFPRVTGNSAQRRRWHPTQLHEDLVERCILLSTQTGERVLDPFSGTGTTLRVCKRVNRCCTLIESSSEYCAHLCHEHDIPVEELLTTGAVAQAPGRQPGWPNNHAAQ